MAKTRRRGGSDGAQCEVCIPRSIGARANCRAKGDGGMSSATMVIFAVSVAPNDWAMLGACFALALAAVIFVFFIQPDASDLAPHRSKLDQLLERRDTNYDNLRDLRFEYRAGKYSE